MHNALASHTICAVLAFAASATLSAADGVIIYKTYPAREKFSAAGDGKRLFNALRESGKESVAYAGGYTSLKKELKKRAAGFNRITFIGAGDIYEIAKKCLKFQSI